MTLRPCLVCGEPSIGTRCDEHSQPTTRLRPKGHVHANPARWKRMSASARRQQPWCLSCGATEDLCGDHIIPVSEAPELALEVLNVAVRCRACNGRRGNTCTDEDRQAVLTAISARKARLARFYASERLNVAPASTETGGVAPCRSAFRSGGTQTPNYTPPGGIR